MPLAYTCRPISVLRVCIEGVRIWQVLVSNYPTASTMYQWCRRRCGSSLLKLNAELNSLSQSDHNKWHFIGRIITSDWQWRVLGVHMNGELTMRMHNLNSKATHTPFRSWRQRQPRSSVYSSFHCSTTAMFCSTHAHLVVQSWVRP